MSEENSISNPWIRNGLFGAGIMLCVVLLYQILNTAVHVQTIALGAAVGFYIGAVFSKSVVKFIGWVIAQCI
jgi:hypothetical protein